MFEKIAAFFIYTVLALTAVSADCEENAPTEKSAPLGRFYEYCGKFESASNFKTVEPVLDLIVKEGYSAEENLSRVDCMPRTINSIKHKIPMVQLLAEDIDRRYYFALDIFEYLGTNDHSVTTMLFRKRSLKSDKKIEIPPGWLHVINAKNTKGMTLLDYLKYNYKGYEDVFDAEDKMFKEVRQQFNDVYGYICERGGEMAYYKNVDCKNGL